MLYGLQLRVYLEDKYLHNLKTWKLPHEKEKTWSRMDVESFHSQSEMYLSLKSLRKFYDNLVVCTYSRSGVM